MHIPTPALLFAALALAQPSSAQVNAPPGTTEWRFTGDTGAFIDALGGPATLEYADGDGGMTDMLDVFTTTTAAGIPDIGGQPASILHFQPHVPATVGYKIRPMTPADPQQFTLIYDLYIGDPNADDYQGLWNGNANNANDAELHLEIQTLGFWHDFSNSGLGTGSIAPGTWNLGQWFRVVYVNDYSGNIAELYVNGTLAFTDVAVDFLYSGNDPALASWILSDQNGDVTEGYIAALVYVDGLLDATAAAALGAPSANGVFDFGVGTNYCVGAQNSTGGFASISAAGSASLAMADLTIRADACPAGVSGIFFTGTMQTTFPFGDGFRCIALPIDRIPPFAFADANGSASRTLDFAAPYAAAFVAGGTSNFQFWYRDAAAMATGFNLTDGLEIAFVP